MSQDMTWEEARAEVAVMQRLAGGDVRVEIGIKPAGLSGMVNLGQQWEFFAGKSMAEIVAKMRLHIEKYLDKHSRETIRKMALAIIDVTADTNACTSAALRLKWFSDLDIERYADAACEEANRLASNGPFSIVTTPSNQEAA